MSEAIKLELLAIKSMAEDGLLRAPAVVEWARGNPDSALHGALEWDDQKAAEEHRYNQVRQLIRLHVVTSDGTPQLVSLSFDRAKNGGYRDIDDVLKSRDMSAVMLADALAELERVQSKYEHVKELTAVWEEVKASRRSVRQRSTSAETGATAG